MRIASLCGSPAAASANRAALLHAQTHLTTTVSSFACDEASLDGIPVFDPRLADDPPGPVQALSDLLVACDGVMIAAPEYAGGLSGGTKTALDWMVGLSSLYHRPVAILSAGTTGGQHALEQLTRTLSWQGAFVVEVLGIEAPRTKIDADGRVVDSQLGRSLERWATGLAEAVQAEPAILKATVARIVSPLGIDVERFGDFGERI